MSSATSAVGRRRPSSRSHNAEDQALNQIAREAETKLAAKRAERAKAREIRMRELEKKQREEEAKQDRVFELSTDKPSAIRSVARRSSEDPLEDTRDLRSQVHDFEEKYKKAMMTSAQLDNEKQALSYNVDLLKDQLYERRETWVELQREYRDKYRECEQYRRDKHDLEYSNSLLKEQVAQRDTLIQEQGLVIVGTETGELTLAKSPNHTGPVMQLGAALVTAEAAEILNNAGEGTLDEKLKVFAREKKLLEMELKRTKDELERERERSELSEKYSYPKIPVSNGPELQLSEIQHEASKQIHEYKLKLQKADQDIATLEGCVNRLENQVKRFQAAAENAEKLEEELKGDKRKLQRELRESKNSIEELQNKNSYLQKRMEKLKQDRIAALVGQ